MAHIPIDLPTQSVHIHAQRDLAFEVIAGMGTGGANGDSPNVVLEKNGNRMLVEFHTPLKIGPFSTTWKSTEWVTPSKPDSIDFDLVPTNGIINGGLRQLTDRFEFAESGNCTELAYKSRFGIRWSIGGWLLGKAVFGPIMKKHMIEHLGDVKGIIENRASRSRLYPQLECDQVDEGVVEIAGGVR